LALIATFALLSEPFLSLSNSSNVARQVAVIGILAVGEALVILAGGVDLSVGAVAGLTGVLLVETAPLGVLPSITLSLAGATAVGCINGLITTRTGINSLIVTLATLTILRGVVLVSLGGFPQGLESRSVQSALWREVWIVPVPFLLFLAFLLVGGFLLSWTRLGTAIYATGGNREAAVLAGLNARRVTVTVFAISGFCAGVGGLLLTSRVNHASPLAGEGTELAVLSAVVIGGVSFLGGRGRLSGVFLGVLLLGVIANGMNLAQIPVFYQQIVQGSLILLAVGLSTLRDRQRS
jgi:ribose transport system permease protein